jgi:hypothetical protein
LFFRNHGFDLDLIFPCVSFQDLEVTSLDRLLKELCVTSPDSDALHLRIVNLFKFCDVDESGDISFCEFRDGLRKLPYDPQICISSEDWDILCHSRCVEYSTLDGTSHREGVYSDRDTLLSSSEKPSLSQHRELSESGFVTAMIRQLGLFIHRITLKAVDLEPESSVMATLMLVLKNLDLRTTTQDTAKHDKDQCTETDRDGTSRTQSPTEMSEGPLYVCASCASTIQHPYTEHVRGLRNAGGLTPAAIDHLSALAGGADGGTAYVRDPEVGVGSGVGAATFRDLFQFSTRSVNTAAGGISKEMTVLMQVLHTCVCVCVFGWVWVCVFENVSL